MSYELIQWLVSSVMEIRYRKMSVLAPLNVFVGSPSNNVCYLSLSQFRAQTPQNIWFCGNLALWPKKCAVSFSYLCVINPSVSIDKQAHRAVSHRFPSRKDAPLYLYTFSQSILLTLYLLLVRVFSFSENFCVYLLQKRIW